MNLVEDQEIDNHNLDRDINRSNRNIIHTVLSANLLERIENKTTYFDCVISKNLNKIFCLFDHLSVSLVQLISRMNKSILMRLSLVDR